MTRSNEEFTIKNGPSKLDLMLALFDTDMGARTVRFQTVEWIQEFDNEDEFDVQIVSVRRRDPSANITVWEIEGFTEPPKGKGKTGRHRVFIHYGTLSREGRMRFEEELRTQGTMETPDDAKRARALMIVIEMMIGRYQNSHRGNLDEEIFKHFEKAKRLHYAEDRKSLDAAIKDI